MKHRKAEVREYKFKLALKLVQCRGYSNQSMRTFQSLDQIYLWNGDKCIRPQEFHDKIL